MRCIVCGSGRVHILNCAAAANRSDFAAALIRLFRLAHITGGGLVENIPRALPEGITAVLQKSAWPMPPLFDWLQRHGGVAETEMHRVFNCGIGMTLIVGEADATTAMRALADAGESVYRIGRIEARTPGRTRTVVV
jgi:phosphoribosylformylglycinamidine cyclo-ligase